MRIIILLATLAVLLSLGLFTLTQTIEGRASASNPSLVAGVVIIDDPTMDEGNSGTSNMTFRVTVLGSHTNTVGVNYSTANGSATSSSDYTSTSGQLVFDPNSTQEPVTKNILVPIIGDTDIEPNETFFVNLQIVDSSAGLEDGQGTGTITNDDTGGCAYAISPTSQNFTASGGTGSVNVTTSAGCSWTASNGTALFSTITSGSSGSGNGTVNYSVQQNPGAARTGTLTIAGQTFTINQETSIGSPCDISAYAISPASKVYDHENSAGTINVFAPSLCSWTATSSAPTWLTVISTTNPAQGSGSINYTVTTNEGSTGRYGEITVNGLVHQVFQNTNNCFAQIICAFFPGACDGFPFSALKVSRSFRDDVLAHTPRGQRYTRLYYQLSSEAVAIVMLNPMLALRSREEMQRYVPVVHSMVKGEEVTLTEGDIEEIDDFLRSFAEKGGSEFRESIKGLREDLRDPQVHGEFKITVIAGPKRALPSKGDLQPDTKIGLMIGPIGFGFFAFLRRKSRRCSSKSVRSGRGFAAAQCGEAPPHREYPLFSRGYASKVRRRSLDTSGDGWPERRSLSALCGGKAAEWNCLSKPNRRRLLAAAILFSFALAPWLIVNGQSQMYSGQWVFTRDAILRELRKVNTPNPPGKYLTANNLRSQPLIMASAPAYSSYFGGSQNEEGTSIAVDSAGNIYVTGFTDSANFPLVNAVQPTFGGGPQDAFVTKLNPAGTQVLYSTYIGGNGQDNATSIAVDSSGNAYITGFTDSTNFPVSNALQSTNRGTFNAFVVKLSPAGAVLNSTLFGGSANDYGSSIAVDSAGNVYVAGLATSADFPTANAMQTSLGGLIDVFMAKINPSGTGLIYSTYLGTSGIEGASSIAVDPAGNLYVTGLTSSIHFPSINPLQANHGGGMFDAFVLKVHSSGFPIVYSTFLGGSSEDRAFRIAVDSAGSAYVTGDTDSTNFPMMNALQPTRGGSADAFVAKLNAAGNQLVYSTYLGGSGVDGGAAIATDASGSAYVSGFTASTNFPNLNALQPNLGGAYDGYVTKLNPSGSALVYSTYLGGSNIDSVFGIATDANANAYVMGVTDSTNFPIANAFQGANGGGTADIFIARLAPTAAPNTVRFESTSYSVSEGAESTRIRVTRSGDLSAASTVEYVVTDGSALQRTDYTLAAGTLGFAAGEASKSFSLLIIDDVYVEGAETVNLNLSSPTGGFSLDSSSSGTLTIQDNDTGPPSVNSIDDSALFVRQHYYDFLNRVPDQGGLDYWTQQITQCGNDATCIRNKRIDVSNAFFYEQEFQQSGAYVYRVYKAAFGTLPGAPNRANLTYAQFMPDRSRVIGGPDLDASKTSFANAFVQRSAFTAQYPSGMTGPQYVDALNTNTGNSLTQAQRDALVSALQSGTETRGTVLRMIADNAAFIDREYNASFVLTEYFGYLRRDPDQGGYDFWLGQVNRYPIRNVAVQHAMVCSFITSAEYQNRFSSVVTHTNAECPAP